MYRNRTKPSAMIHHIGQHFGGIKFPLIDAQGIKDAARRPDSRPVIRASRTYLNEEKKEIYEAALVLDHHKSHRQLRHNLRPTP